MSDSVNQLVTRLRLVQWEVDSVVYSLPYGTASRQQLDKLAHAMQQVASELRAHGQDVIELDVGVSD